jgi:hypothetical protein
MGFEDVSVISDLDYMFSCDFKHLLESLGLDVNLSEKLRKHIEFDRDGDPSLEYVVEKNKGKDEPEGFDDLLKALEKERIFVLRKGSPEQYYKAGSASKSFWDDIGTKDDLLDAGDLESLMKTILA